MSASEILPRCPSCGSTDVTRSVLGYATDPVPSSAAVTEGFEASDRHRFECRSCGQSFEPPNPD